MEFEKIIDKVIKVSKEAGNIIKENFEKISSKDIQIKGNNDFVTNIDRKCEILIIESLRDLVQQAGFIAEENPSLEIAEEYNWIVDPLDGTTNFINGIYPCSVSIALKRNDEIVLGVVYEVGKDECFYALKNNGAYLNNKRINVSTKSKLANSFIGTGFPYNEFGKLDDYIDLLKELAKTTQGIRRLGSAATDLAYVACGRFDGFYEYDLKPYDVAAGIILVEEAGGKICDFKGGNNYLFGKEIVASNSYIFEEFKAIVMKYMSR